MSPDRLNDIGLSAILLNFRKEFRISLNKMVLMNATKDAFACYRSCMKASQKRQYLVLAQGCIKPEEYIILPPEKLASKVKCL